MKTARSLALLSVVITATLIFAFAQTSWAFNASNYFPLAPGNYRTYRVTDNGTASYRFDTRLRHAEQTPRPRDRVLGE